MITALSLLLILAPPPEGAIVFPGEPSFGAQIHTTGNGKDMAAIGANWARLDITWSHLEVERQGNYNFAKYEAIIQNYLDYDINVLGLLCWHCFPSKLYEDPASDENFVAAVAGFADFSRACAKHFKGKVAIWELGNEPEVFPVGKVNKPKRYTILARAAAKAIREVDTDVHVAALSTAWMDRGFITRSLEAGLLDDSAIDVVSFHGYHRANLMPESGLVEDVGWLRDMIRKHAPNDQKIIVIDSERGYVISPFLNPKHWASWRTIVYTEAEQAAYLARHFIEEIHLGIEVSIWYKDMYGENNCSLYRGGPGTEPRPMGHMMRNLAAILDLNPKQLVNDRYTVSLVDLPDKVSDPNAFVKVRSFYHPDRKQLIVALWNPVEAFDGRILDSRKRIKDSYYESWRAVSPDDRVDVALRVSIAGPSAGKLTKAVRYNLTAEKDDELRTTLKVTAKDRIATTDQIKVGPTPTILVMDISP